MRTQIILLTIGISAVILDLIISIYQAVTEFRKQYNEFNEDYDTTNTTTAFHKTNKTSSTPRSARPRTYTTMRHNAPHQNPSTPHQNRRGGGRCSGGEAGRRNVYNEDVVLGKVVDEYAKNMFGGRCPYNNEKCATFDCLNCKVEKEEKFMREVF